MNDLQDHRFAVDVVVLSHNRTELTLQTLASIFEQRDVDTHIWLVDQGSDEPTLDALRAAESAHDNVSLIELGHNVGVPAGRNIGASQGCAPLIVNIDNDAVFDTRDALAHTAGRMYRQPGLGAVAFRILNFSTRREESWSYPEGLRPLAHAEWPSARFVGCGHAIRRTAFEEAGGFDHRLFFCEEELDLSMRLLDSGYEIVYDPNATVLHKVAPEARVRWDGGRFYYQTRNALFIEHKYFRSKSRTCARAAGYLLKAAYNLVLSQAVRGMVDAWRMTRQDAPRQRLSARARDYIELHESRYRGGVAQRLRSEVFSPP